MRADRSELDPWVAKRLTPISDAFGFDRGQPIDRFYIAQFLSEHAPAIRGRTLEVGDANYTSEFGGRAVDRSDVLDPSEDNPLATIVGNLETGRGVPSEAFDCIILTQVLPVIFDVRAAVAATHRALRRGGVVLATLPGLCRFSPAEMAPSGDYWRFSPRCASRLFAESYGDGQVEVASYGSVLTACAFLYGLAAHELEASELGVHDPHYPVVIGVRAERDG